MEKLMFEIGQQVVCVDANDTVGLVNGAVYLVVGTEAPFLQISFWANSAPGGNSWFQRRFRPVRKTDIGVFTQMLVPVTPKKLAPLDAG